MNITLPRPHTVPTAARALPFVAAAFLLVAFVALVDMALQVNRMASSLSYVNNGVQTLHEKLSMTNTTLAQVSRKLTSTNQLLHATNTKLLLTNAKLDLTNQGVAATNHGLQLTFGQLSHTNQAVVKTNAEVMLTNTSLAGMQALLSDMNLSIHAMTHKITHAKLLF